MGATYKETLRDSNGQPLQGVMVVLYRDGVKIDVETTDHHGRFIFENLTTDYYELRFFGRGFTPDDTRYVSVIDEILTTDLAPNLRLQNLLSHFDSIQWASRAVIEACVDNDLTTISGIPVVYSGIQNTLVLSDSVLKPLTTEPNTQYIYRTKPIDLTISGQVSKAILFAEYYLDGDANIKIETTFSGLSDDAWFTWIDTANTVIVGSGEYWANGYWDISQLETTPEGLTSSGIDLSGWIPGNAVEFKVTITSGEAGNSGYLESLALITDPSIWI